MSGPSKRLTEGGLIDRSKSLGFTFDGKRYSGFEGDTLASALLANGEVLMARSFKYHRPRGVMSAGPEEPNALIKLRTGARQEPNTRATMIELYDGLVAESQNRKPSLRWDYQAMNQLIGRFIPAGFYYKTFMGPFANTKLWMQFEKLIRKSAGMGEASWEADPDLYTHRSAHCEVLVIGGGPAGLAAARAAAEGGGRVILVEETPHLGGRLRKDSEVIDGLSGSDWAAAMETDLAGRDNVRILKRTTAFGYYDQNMVGCCERVADHLVEPAAHQPRQRMWNIRAGRVIIAAGAVEQPLVFGDNDRPNIMLAGAVRAYVNEYGVLPGERAIVFANNDDGYRTALDLAKAGGNVKAVVDPRDEGAGELADAVRALDIPVLNGHAISRARGGATGIQAAEIVPVSGSGMQHMDCDLIAMSGGWQPTVHLSSQTGSKPVWDDSLKCFVPGAPRQKEVSAGAAAGTLSLADCLSAGRKAGAEAAGVSAPSWSAPKPESAGLKSNPTAALWEAPGTKGKRFVDHQDDVTTSDVKLAHREGFISVEHLKRYTTLGMGTDQGKTSNLNGLAIMASLTGKTIPETGTTTFRPPYTPVSIGLLGGPEVGKHFAPLRRTAMDSWHDEQGCEWIDAGLWRRPRYYPKAGEGIFEAYVRETKETRGGVGVCDVTTLGKIDIQGPDAADFLNRVYTNGWKALAVGKARYGLMCREDGIVFDDGTTSRLAEDHFVMTTTTANAVKVMAWLEYYLQFVWPDLKVQVTSVTDQWAAVAVAGPKSRALLEKVVDIDLSNDAFPFMACGDVSAAGVKGRLFRISFSGEMAFELNVPADYGRHVWEAVMKAGEELGAVAYGTEALGNMRIEKGHVAGPELDGRTTADDLNLGKMMSTKKDFIGKRLAYREDLVGDHRHKFVGLMPVDGKSKLIQGAQITENANDPLPVKMIGNVTSTGYNSETEMPIALGLVEGGLAREGDIVHMQYPLRNVTVPVKVCHPIFIDREGARHHG